MKYALLEPEQLDGLRPSLDTIALVLARRATHVGDRIPVNKRPPQAYTPGAAGWTISFALYPQDSGRTVVVMEDAAHAMLSPPSRALFDLPGFPDGFSEGLA